MLTSFAYVRANSTREAAQHLSTPGARIHAGGTDLLGCLRDGVFEASKVVSLSGVQELRGISETPQGGLRIGALTTLVDVAENPLVEERYPGLAQAVLSAASPQLRNQGTLGGNICQRPRCWYYRGEFHCARKGGAMCYAVDGENRYHAIFGGDPCYIVHPSDSAPALVALNASVRITGSDAARSVPLEDFFVLPEDNLAFENVLEPDEIVTDIVLPPPGNGSVSTYRKVRERGAWDFALASVAVAMSLRDGIAHEARIVLGGVAPRPWRSKSTEQAINGRRLDAETAAAAAEAAVQGAEPLAQNGYKVELIKGIVEETLRGLA